VKKKQKIDRSKATVPAILREPIVIESTDPRLIREGLAQQMGLRLAAVCEYFSVSAADIDFQGPTGTLILKMAEHCFPEAFRVVSSAEALSTPSRKHKWAAPKKRALVALVDEYREKGHSVEKAIEMLKTRYKNAPRDQNYLDATVKSLATRYHDFKKWADKNALTPAGETGLPLNPDGAINFRAAASQLFSLHEKRHG
jgi:hypothetical protein